jgi:SAM-dependent methyltransferase
MTSPFHFHLNESFDAWMETSQGQYVIQWEQAQFDRIVENVFGYNAVQIGAGKLASLRSSRIQTRLVLLHQHQLQEAAVGLVPSDDAQDRTAFGLIESFDDLPIGDESLDLLVLPHLLEFSEDPHALLREVDRVLRPEGKLIVTGFNPVSLWGLTRPTPRKQLISPPRLRDWLKLLNYESDQSAYGCYRPPFVDHAWLQRWAFLETAGDQWWPICGAVYFHCATKKVPGMRLIGPAWKKRSAKASARPALVGKLSGQPNEREAA